MHTIQDRNEFDYVHGNMTVQTIRLDAEKNNLYGL